MPGLLHRILFIPGLLITGSFGFCQTSDRQYFQQEVNYRINVSLNDSNHELAAYESVQYINNSNDTLLFLYFHLWPNGYSDNSTPLARQLMERDGQQKLFRDDFKRGFIDSLDFRTEGQEIRWNFAEGCKDICILNLPEGLKPSDTIVITTPFHVKIPGGISSRMGHIGRSYQISQWYPKPAVYDKYGWHPMPYLDQGEFFSEFGSYDVSITLPDDYTVAASGELQDSSEAERLEQLASDTLWMFRKAVKPAMSHPGKIKTIRYTRDQIHDFAWFADKDFHVLKDSVKLPGSGSEVILFLMFSDEQSGLWIKAREYAKRSILCFSGWIGDYPYRTYTAVQTALAAGSGMEYPGLGVIGIAENAYTLDEVIAHEICHSWFYSSLASDERLYPFMDESITCAYESRYMNLFYPGKKLWEVYLRNRKLARFFDIMRLPVERMSELEWLMQARNNLDQRIDLPAPEFTELNYTNIIYFKASQGFILLQKYLGDAVFDSIMHYYYSSWRGKHPYPEDLRNIFMSGTDKNSDWFFNDFLGTVKQIDYKISGLQNKDLIMKNRGELSSPLEVNVLSGDSTVFAFWTEGFSGSKKVSIPVTDFTGIKINMYHTAPELYYLNNNIRRAGFFRKIDPIRFQLVYSFDLPDRNTVAYAPLLNWNRADGIMAGFVFNNGFLLPKHFEFSTMPFYSFRRSELTGKGRFAYNFMPYDNLFRKITVSFEGSRFGVTGTKNYSTTRTGLDLYFRNPNMINGYEHRLFGKFITASDLFLISEQSEKAVSEYFWQFGYVIEKYSFLTPFRLTTLFETGDSYSKTSFEMNYGLSYYGKNNGLDIRLFGGMMLKSNPAYSFYNFAPSGRSGRELHFYQGEFPDRFAIFPETFWSRQMIITEGGIVSPVNDSTGFSSWLLSASFSSVLPVASGRIPVVPFLNMVYNDRSKFYYEAGFRAGIKNVFEFYIPLLVSSDISSVRPSVKSRIRFILNIEAIHLFKAPSERKD